MGSDDGLKSRTANTGVLRNVLSFLAGCVASFFLLTTAQSSRHILTLLKANLTSSSPLASSGDCQISYGTYRGKEYTTDMTVGQPQCLVESKFLKVQQHQVSMPSASDPTAVIPDWLWIDYHDRINVLVEDERRSSDSERQFLVFEQTKYALEARMSLAIVGGIIEPGEQPHEAAAREVEEEMKMQCDSFHFLGRYRTDVNRGMGWTNTFLASQCSKAIKDHAEHHLQGEEVGIADTERQDLKRIGLSELREAVRDGKFLEIQWTATISLALLHPELAS